MAATDIDLPKLKTPGLTNPPQVSAAGTIDPAAGVKTAVQAAANATGAGQATPYPQLPVGGPTTTNQAGETYTPEKGWNPVNAVVGFAKDTAAAARGNGTYDELRGAREANQSSYGMGPAADATRVVGAIPQASYSNEGRVTRADITIPPDAGAPAATAAPAPTSSIAARPVNNTPVSDPYSGPAAGMINPNVTPTSGVADGMRQLQNLQALRDMTPQGGVAVLPDRQEAENAVKTHKWAVEDAIAGMNKQGTRTGRAAAGQLVAQMQAGQNQLATTALNNEGQNQRNDANNQTALAGQGVQRRGQDLTHGLGMVQASVQARGQDLNHEGTMAQVGATVRGQDVGADTQRAGFANQAAIHEAMNATQERLNAAANASREGIAKGSNQTSLDVADRQAATAIQSKQMGVPVMPGQWTRTPNGYERVVTDKKTGKSSVERMQ